MIAQVLQGTKQEIAEKIVLIPGDVREVIVVIEQPVVEAAAAPPEPGEDIFAEMAPYESKAIDVDYSREAIYSRMEGE